MLDPDLALLRTGDYVRRRLVREIHPRLTRLREGDYEAFLAFVAACRRYNSVPAPAPGISDETAGVLAAIDLWSIGEAITPDIRSITLASVDSNCDGLCIRVPYLD